MISYAESNFVLELALGQEGEPDARAILEAAQRGEVALALPAFALCEPYGTVTQRARQRRQSFSPIENQLRDLQRNAANQELVEALRRNVATALEFDRREMDDLERVVGELLQCVRILPLSSDAHHLSAILQAEHDLDPADALIAASILEDAQRQDDAKVFTTRNSRHFDFPAVHERFAAQQCELVFSFADARARLRL